MCGIVGVLGKHEAAPLILEALKRLEYRGYDSAGIATVHDGALDRRRAVGKLINLSDRLVHEPLTGKSGIGHTRWATHGGPSELNAHPHRAGPVAVVHNGIIENYAALRAELAAAGYDFTTETDSETIALLTQKHLDGGLSAADAAFATLERLEGAFALAFLFDGEDDLIVAARKGSPLAIGWGDGEMFVGSDAIALAPMTDRITYLDEGDRAILTRTAAPPSSTTPAPAPTAPCGPSKTMKAASRKAATSTGCPRKSPSSPRSSPTRWPITPPAARSPSPKAPQISAGCRAS